MNKNLIFNAVFDFVMIMVSFREIDRFSTYEYHMFWIPILLVMIVIFARDLIKTLKQIKPSKKLNKETSKEES